MRTLIAQDIADFIKERQAHQVRSLRQAHGVQLTLTADTGNPSVEVYGDYAEDIGVAFEVAKTAAKITTDPPEATAILWLCAGYNIETRGKQVAIVGNNELTDHIADVLQKSGSSVLCLAPNDDQLAARVMSSEIVVTTASKVQVTADMLRPGTVVIELLPGGVEPTVFSRHDLLCTRQKEGLVPLTVAVIVDRLIAAARP
jgi:5,10-methylene-tetrahydrofolate dehydrogenase/methenyl tetrahydrofolate cyclohydrolase